MCREKFPPAEYPKYYINLLATERRFIIIKVVNPKTLFITDFTLVPGGVVSSKEELESHEPESVNLLLNGFNFRYKKYKQVHRGTYLRYKGIANHVRQNLTLTSY
jgi:hypothetical protein